jgi:hypothetical protein
MIQRSGILEILAYFDLFNYPLTEGEIHRFLKTPDGVQGVGEALTSLVAESLVFRLGNFYALRNDPALETVRIKANSHAGCLLPVALRTSRFLMHFPFVRGIAISGSLSKDCSEEKGDIDYFIITSGGRLWLARTTMHLFKKLTYLAGRQHWYCMNYYVDQQALTIGERNIYTAMEIVTLIPAAGFGAIQDFWTVNGWTSDFFSPAASRPEKKTAPSEKYRVKSALEKILDNVLGDRLDDYLMRVTRRRWMKKERKGRVNMHGNRMGIVASKHFCKPNPGFLQDKILTRYYQSLSKLRQHLQLNTGQDG